MARTKYALVTGCGEGGIGEALVAEYTRRDIIAIATILPSESSAHLTIPGIPWFHLDVTDEDSVLALKKEIVKLTGGYLDILVNNAGICYTMPAIDTDVEAAKRMFDVNLFGPMRMVRYFHDMLIRSSGAIVNISSIGGIVPYVYGSAYNASKAGLAHWGNTLRVEMAPLNVKVLTIISGEVGTNILKNDYNRTLPEGSFYAPLADEFIQHVQRKPTTTDRFVFASKVVEKSLASSLPAWFWTGSLTTLIRFLDMFFPRRIFLGKLREAHLKRRED